MNEPSSAFLEYLRAKLDSEDVVAIGLTGSHARGTATPYSDLDIYRFGQQPPKDAYDRYHLEVVEGYLVSITKATITDKRSDLAQPDSAIRAVPGLRQMQILLDKNGELAALKQEAEHFRWPPLQPAADHYASAELSGNAEEARKVLSGLWNNDESTLLYGTYGLVLGLSRILLVQRGVLLESENVYFEEAQNAAGIESSWSQHFRIAAGFDTLPEQGPGSRMRALAGLQLYVETVGLLHAIIKPEHREVIEMTVELIQSAILKEHS